jgi:hypothetical protein
MSDINHPTGTPTPAELQRIEAERVAREAQQKAEREAREAETKRQMAQRQQPNPETVAAKYAGPQSQQPTVVDGGGRVVSAPAAEDAEKKRLAAEPSNLTPNEKAEYESHRPAPKPVKDVVRTPEETMRANLEAPGHKIGDAIDGNIARSFRADCGLFQCGIDALGRVWRVEDGENGMRLVLAGWLNT